MGQYTNKGLYSAYDRNNKERQKDDYYATPPWEVTNILNTLDLPIDDNSTILEPCLGGGHMLQAIIDWCGVKDIAPTIYASDIKDRGFRTPITNVTIKAGEEYDYMLDNYEFDSADYIIMNPPFKLIEPFCIRSFEIAKKGIVCFARLQFLEGVNRYTSIFENYPPNDVYVYIDRVMCYKNGDLNQTGSSAQAYAWFYWDMENIKKGAPRLHWIRRAE